MKLSLWGINYSDWTQTCQMYFSLKKGVKEAYLQYFPLSKLSRKEMKTLMSETFFSKYVNNGGFLYHKEAVFVTDNYILKGDNTFRDVKLLSLLLFLVLQAIGMTISKKYQVKRPSEISVYYAGNYHESNCFYKKEYNKFFKEINTELIEYKYFIKTDIRNFFSNINIDKLIDLIEKNCNSERNVFPQIRLFIWKEFLHFCGNGNFPCNENSLAASYLSTVVYMDEIDTLLFNWLKNNKCIKKFKMIRYVDDLYILLNPDFDRYTEEEVFHELFTNYSSYLKSFDLSLNFEKCVFSKIEQINEVLKQSLYDDYFSKIKFHVSDLYKKNIIELLDYLIDLNKNHRISNKNYRNSIFKYLHHDDMEFSPLEIFNYFVFNDDSFKVVEGSREKVIQLLLSNIEIVKLDPKLLVILLLKTKDGELIKHLLNNQFNRFRNGKWSKYDTTVVINYLIQRNFKHTDIKKCLLNEANELNIHISKYCEQAFLSVLNDDIKCFISEYLQTDWKSSFMYFMYLVELQRKNYLTAFAYYKNYFDRLTAFLENKEKPKFNDFFKKSQQKKFYSKIDNSAKILEKAFNMRNHNPISHASAELINEHFTSEKILLIIEELDKLLSDYICLNKLKGVSQ